VYVDCIDRVIAAQEKQSSLIVAMTGYAQTTDRRHLRQERPADGAIMDADFNTESGPRFAGEVPLTRICC